MPRKPQDPTKRLARLHEQVERWRSTRTKQSPMPAELWVEAAALARTLGESVVRTRLRLNAESLRTRVAGDGETTNAAPMFVRLDATPQVREAATVVELSDRSGTTLKVHLPAGSRLDVAELVAAFRGGRSCSN